MAIHNTDKSKNINVISSLLLFLSIPLFVIIAVVLIHAIKYLFVPVFIVFAGLVIWADQSSKKDKKKRNEK